MYNDPSQTAANASTKSGSFQQGWAQALLAVDDRTNAASGIKQHDNGMGIFAIQVASATQASYSKWATMTKTGPTATASATATVSFSAVPVPTATSYDYVVVGGGAGGIPMADKLSQAGYSVLLIEKGPASSARWGGSKYSISVQVENWTNGCSSAT
jgi:cellobiose dehydrogenase (acceptor)